MDKQWSTKNYTEWATRTHTNNRVWTRYTERVCSSCSTGYTRGVTLWNKKKIYLVLCILIKLHDIFYWNKRSCPYWIFIKPVSFSAFVLIKVNALVLRTRSSLEYSCGEKLVISKTGRFICFNSTSVHSEDDS